MADAASVSIFASEDILALRDDFVNRQGYF